MPLNTTWDDGPEAFLRRFRKVPPGIGHLYAANWCESEVCNGGLLQFFSNTTGILAPETLAGFRAMGLIEWADILAEAMRFFGELYPRDRDERLALLSRMSGEERDSFDRLDARFYAWLEGEPDRWERVADAYARTL